MKPISDYLQQLINEANEAIEQSHVTIKEKLLYVYNQAIEEGYTPKTAHKLMRENIKDVSDRYIRKVLPDEAKRNYILPERERRYLAEQIGTVPNKNESRHINIEPIPEEPEEQEPLAPYTATDDFLKREQEAEQTEQLLREERAKNAQLKERLEQKDGELEDHAFRLQELSRRLTEATTKVVDIDDDVQGEVEKPKFEQHWNQFVDSECSFCHKVTPLVIRHFISGKVVKWIDRDRYKELHGMVPAE